MIIFFNLFCIILYIDTIFLQILLCTIYELFFLYEELVVYLLLTSNLNIQFYESIVKLKFISLLHIFYSTEYSITPLCLYNIA